MSEFDEVDTAIKNSVKSIFPLLSLDSNESNSVHPASSSILDSFQGQRQYLHIEDVENLLRVFFSFALRVNFLENLGELLLV